MTMKTRFLLGLSVLSLFVFGSFSLGRAQQSAKPFQEEEEIRRFVEKYDNAWNHKDSVALEQILAPDYVYFGSKGDVRSRQSLLEEFISPKYHLDSAERSELNVYLTSGTAVVSSRWKGHGTYDGQEFNDDQRCSIVLARHKADWLVASEHCTQIALPQTLTDTATGLTVKFENERIRVLELRLKPGQSERQHSHPQYVLYPLNDYRVRNTNADGTVRTFERKAGEVFWGEPITHGGENVGTTDVHAIIVELKPATSP
jgi:ketosteroid isomerase-like protein